VGVHHIMYLSQFTGPYFRTMDPSSPPASLKLNFMFLNRFASQNLKNYASQKRRKALKSETKSKKREKVRESRQ